MCDKCQFATKRQGLEFQENFRVFLKRTVFLQKLSALIVSAHPCAQRRPQERSDEDDERLANHAKPDFCGTQVKQKAAQIQNRKLAGIFLTTTQAFVVWNYYCIDNNILFLCKSCNKLFCILSCSSRYWMWLCIAD